MVKADYPIVKIAADVLVIGGGIAALRSALAANQSGAKVRIVSKRRLLAGGLRLWGVQKSWE